MDTIIFGNIHISRLIRDGNTSTSLHLNLELFLNLENSMFSHISASNTAVCRGEKTGKNKKMAGMLLKRSGWVGPGLIQWGSCCFNQLRARHLGYFYSVMVYFNPHGIDYSSLNHHFVNILALPETKIAPENKPSPKRIHLPTIDFQGLY